MESKIKYVFQILILCSILNGSEIESIHKSDSELVSFDFYNDKLITVNKDLFLTVSDFEKIKVPVAKTFPNGPNNRLKAIAYSNFILLVAWNSEHQIYWVDEKRFERIAINIRNMSFHKVKDYIFYTGIKNGITSFFKFHLPTREEKSVISLSTNLIHRWSIFSTYIDQNNHYLQLKGYQSPELCVKICLTDNSTVSLAKYTHFTKDVVFRDLNKNTSFVQEVKRLNGKYSINNKMVFKNQSVQLKARGIPDYKFKKDCFFYIDSNEVKLIRLK